MYGLRRLTVLAWALLAGAVGCDKCGGGGGDVSADARVATQDAAAPGDASTPNGPMNATPLPAASIAAAINPDNLPPYAGPTGSVEGTISVVGDPAEPTPTDFSRCPDAANTWGHAFREGPAGPNGARPLADSIVVVTGYVGYYLPETQEAKEIRIEDCAYTARTVTLTFGQRLEVKNLSKDYWTPVLEPGANMVLMMAPPHGDAVRIYPKKFGRHLLLDRDRKYVAVDVFAFRHRLHATSAVTGHYRIDGLPVGKVTVSTKHPQIDAVAERELVVAAGVVHKIDLVLAHSKPEAGAAPGGGLDAALPPALR